MSRPHTAPSGAPGGSRPAEGAGHGLLTAAFVVLCTGTVVAAALSPLTLQQTWLGVALGVVAVLVAVAALGSKRPDGRLSPQWGLTAVGQLRGWHVIADVPVGPVDTDTDTHLGSGDLASGSRVDAVIVAPAAVLAVATRRHGSPVGSGPADRERHHHDLAVAEQAAHDVTRLLRDGGAGSIDQPVSPAVPVLVISGRGGLDVPGGHVIDNGVHVVDGTRPELWVHHFARPTLTAPARHELAATIAAPGRALRHGGSADSRIAAWRELRGALTTRAARTHA